MRVFKAAVGASVMQHGASFRVKWAVLAVVLGVCEANAAERPRLLVVPFSAGDGAPESSSARFASQVFDELKSRDEAVEMVAAPAAGRVGSDKASKSKGADAAALLDDGKRALADLKFVEAADKLKKGIDATLADPANADVQAVLQAYVSLAVAAFRMGDEHEAQNSLLALARLDPNYAMPSGYPPAFTREFDRAKKKLEKQGKGALSIEGPSGSTAFVDGRDLGMVPALDETVFWGTHYVRVEGPKGERFGQAVELKGSMVRVRATFSNDKNVATVSEPKVGATLDEATVARIGAYAKSAQADFALVGIVYRTGDNQLTAGTAIYSARKQGVSLLPPISFDSDALTSTVEAFRLSDEVIKRLGSFTVAASLPVSLLAKPVVKVGVAVAPKVADVEVAAPRRIAVAPKDTPARAGLAPAPAVAVEPTPDASVAANGQGTPKWVWVLVGVGAAAAVGITTGVVVGQVTKPYTINVTVNGSAR